MRPTLPVLVRLAAVLLSASVSLPLARAESRPLVPIESFFDYGSVNQVTLSPDGTKIAMLAPNEGRYSIALLDLATGQVSVVVRFKDENINSVFWKGNDRLLFTSTIEGHEVPLLASTDLAGKSVKRILEPRRTKDDFSIFFGNLSDRYPASDGHILITGYTSESDARKVNPSVPRNPTPSIYKVNVATARRAQVATLEQRMGSLYFDAEANIRLSTVREGSQTVFQVRQRNGQPWHELKRFEEMDERWNVLVLMADGHTAYLVDQTTEPRGVLRALDLDTHELGPVIFAPPAGEIVTPILSPKRQRLLGVIYESDRYHAHWIDAQWKAISAALEQQFPDHSVGIQSIADDEKRFIVRTYSDRDPGQFYLGDMRTGGLRLQFITAARPAIKPEQMSPTIPVEFKARDGLTIHGYLTKPGGRADKNTPLLIHPHGGPFGIRDSWGFNPEVQFLANRGYAVFQINYRGSGGYGRDFEEAGYKEWGAKMQNDLSDGVAWAIAQGLADADRVGIIGASYGGYAALAGVTMTPELYRVGINYVGVSDLRLITRWDLGRGRAAKTFYEKAVGRDADFLKSRSPVEFVANIRVPTLHAYGKNDPRVEFNNWEVLEKALKAHGKTYEALIEDKEGHGFRKEDSSNKFYSAVEKFLAKHMPADGLTADVTLHPQKVIEMPAKESK